MTVKNKLYQIDQMHGDVSIVAKNSYAAEGGDFIKNDSGFGNKAGIGDTILGSSNQTKTYASDNETVDKLRLNYIPLRDELTWDTGVTGQTLTFNVDLVTSNTINLKVNGVAMGEVTFATSHAATMAVIATALETEFSSVIESADVDGGDDKIINVRLVGLNATIVVTDIVVAAGAGQATGVYADIALTDVDIGKFYDLTATEQHVNASTESASTGQMKLESFSISGDAIFSVANA